MNITSKLVHWAADECVRQQSGEKSVAHMIDAVLWINGGYRSTWVESLLKLAELVEPEKNKYGFRRQPVTIGGTVVPVYEFEEKLMRLCGWAAINQITPDEWYQEFEALHPFNDGNGRIGAIIYNYLKGNDENSMKVPPPYEGNTPNHYESPMID